MQQDSTGHELPPPGTHCTETPREQPKNLHQGRARPGCAPWGSRVPGGSLRHQGPGVEDERPAAAPPGAPGTAGADDAASKQDPAHHVLGAATPLRPFLIWGDPRVSPPRKRFGVSARPESCRVPGKPRGPPAPAACDPLAHHGVDFLSRTRHFQPTGQAEHHALMQLLPEFRPVSFSGRGLSIPGCTEPAAKACAGCRGGTRGPPAVRGPPQHTADTSTRLPAGFEREASSGSSLHARTQATPCSVPHNTPLVPPHGAGSAPRAASGSVLPPPHRGGPAGG